MATCECETFPTGSPSRYDSYREGEEMLPNPNCPVHDWDDDVLRDLADQIQDTYGLVHANNDEWVDVENYNEETGDPLPEPGQPYPFRTEYVGRWANVYGATVGKFLIIGEDSKGCTLLLRPPRGIIHEDFWNVQMTADPPLRIVPPNDVPDDFNRNR